MILKKRKFEERLAGIKRFTRLAEPNVPLFALSALLLVFSSLFEGIGLGLIMPFLTLMVKGGDYTFLTRAPVLGFFLKWVPTLRFRTAFFILTGGILFAVTVKNIFIYFSELVISSVIRSSEHALRTKIFDRYLSFSKVFFDKNKIGNLCDLAVSQVILACDSVRYMHSLLLNFFLLAVYVLMGVLISWKLTLTAFCLIPFVYVLIRVISKKIILSVRYKFQIDQEMSAYLYDVLTNITLVRSCSREEAESANYSKISAKSRQSLHSIWKKILFAPHAQDVILTFAIAGLVSVCIFIFLKGQAEGQIVSVAAFLSFFIVLRRFSVSLNQLGSNFTEMVKALEPIRQIDQIFDDRDKQFIQNGRSEFKGLQNGIEFKDVCLGHDGQTILNGIDLVFRKGALTALVGPTGSGKTTLIHMVPRFYDVTSGGIYFDGVDIKDFELKSLRRKIAFVSQEVPILNATIRQNITYGLESRASEEELVEACKKAQIHDFVMSLPGRYETWTGDHGARLSGGEKQRIAIARAILKAPDIFIFDEATSSLDMETELGIQKSIQDLTKGKTVLVVAHQLSTIRNADHIIVIERGRVAEEGSFEELLNKKGCFSYYWNLQART